MPNKTKLTGILLLLVIIVLGYYFLIAKRIILEDQDIQETKSEASNKQLSSMTIAELTVYHKKEVKYLITEIENIFTSINDIDNFGFDDNSIETRIEMVEQKRNALLEEIATLRQRVVNLYAPADEYKDLHLGIILSLNKIENFLTNGNDEQLSEAKEIIKNIRLKYAKLLD